jgi:hypothetical protein
MDLLDLLIRMLGLVLQVVGLLLTWTGFRSLAQLRIKVASTPILLPPRPQAFIADKPTLAALAALAKSEALAEQRFDRHYRELRFLSAVTLQRLMARAGWGIVVVGIGTLAGTLSTEIAELLGALYRLLIR